MDDLISRRKAIDAMGKAKWAKERLMELPSVQPDHVAGIGKKVEGDCISRQAAIDIFDDYNVSVENGELEAYSRDRKRLCGLPSAQPATNCSEIPNGSDDTISKQEAIDALWKALYEYEDETEKQFQESEDLDVGDWIGHRIFVQNMSDIDRQTILSLPSAQPEQHWIPCSERLPKEKQSVLVTDGSVVWVCDIISTDEGYKWEDSHGYWLDLDEWTAWMPLPKPIGG